MTIGQTFTFIPDRSFTSNTKPRVRRVKFGDAYEQRLRDGLNTVEKKWSLSFVNRTNTDINDLIEFFDDKGGVDYFYWTPPGTSTQYKVIAADWKDSYITDTAGSLQVNFQRVFDP